jgi:hypothetical protein
VVSHRLYVCRDGVRAMGKKPKSKSVKKSKVGVFHADGSPVAGAQMHTSIEEVTDSTWSNLLNFELRLINGFADVASSSPHLSEGEKDAIKATMDNLSYVIARLSQTSGPYCTKAEAFQILSHAFTIGIFSTPTPEYIENMTKAPFIECGKKSGDIRLKNAETGWMALALELAKESRQEKPRGTLDDVAEYIENNWKQKRRERNDARIQSKLPTREYLKTIISQWIKDDLLPAKKKW